MQRSLVRTTLTLAGAATLAAGSLTAAQAGPTPLHGRGLGACTRTLSAGTQTVQVHLDGAAYPVRVHVPTTLDRRHAAPLVLDLHGSNSNGVAQAPISGLDALAERNGFIVAEPTAAIPLPTTTPLPDGNWAWNVPGVPTTAGAFPPAGARDDVAFLTSVVEQVGGQGCVDRKRVYATGYSGGGRMASALACARPDLLAAIAPVSGLRAGRATAQDLSQPDPTTCTPSRPVSVVTFHGTADVVNPYPGNDDLRWGYSTPTAVAAWARIDQCRRGPVSVPVTEHVTRTSYLRCKHSTDVVAYTVAGGGHTWPGTAVDLSPLGVTTQEISASQLMWDFFARHPRR